MSRKIEELSSDNLKKKIAEDTETTLVYFSAPWCGPCKTQSANVQEIAEKTAELLGFKVVKVDVDKNPKSCADFGIRSIPTMLLFKNKSVKTTWIGVRPVEEVLEEIQTVHDQA